MSSKASTSVKHKREEGNNAVIALNTPAFLKNYAKKVFGDKMKAADWLNFPRKQFNGKTPNEMAQTVEGKEAVREILGRIEHGMFG